VLRVGSVATLSRNFQLQWLRPVLAHADARVVLHSGTARELLAQLSAHVLDVVLSNEPVPGDQAAGWHSQLIAQQQVSLVSRPPRGRAPPLRFPQDLDGRALLLPGTASALRAAFDTLLSSSGVQPLVLAEVDDMAMLRLLARETGALTLVPPVVVADELLAGVLVERLSIPQLVESFYAITLRRRFPHPLLRELMAGAKSAASDGRTRYSAGESLPQARRARVRGKTPAPG
jgi:LysR family transcriptional activator of nhaA